MVGGSLKKYSCSPEPDFWPASQNYSEASSECAVTREKLATGIGSSPDPPVKTATDSLALLV
jgi:hypothetical protein